MIAAHLEPKGLQANAKPIADFGSRGMFDAEKGSRRLRDAILRAALPRTPRRKPKTVRPRTWKARQMARIEVLRVQGAASFHFKIKIAELIGARGRKKLAWQRQIAMFVAREATLASYPDIGLCFGGRDHTTVIHACRVIAEDNAAQHHVNVLRKALGR